MILVDTSIWVDHLRQGNPLLIERLQSGLVYTHVFIIGEIALGSLRQRDRILGDMRHLPTVIQASDDEVQHFVETAPLHGLGIGYIDAHLLVSARLMPGMTLWTRDNRLHAAADSFGLADPALS